MGLKEVAVMSKTQVDLQTHVLRLLETTFEVTRLALLLLFIYGVNDASRTCGSNAVKIALECLWMK